MFTLHHFPCKKMATKLAGSGQVPTDEEMKISAYISLHDDWQLLSTALQSIDNFVDEIVVVDGAYTWMSPFFEAQGRDPTRSTDLVYEVLTQFSKKTKFVNKTWTNEVEKRRAGFEATTGQYVLRADADEIIFLKDNEIESYFSSGKPVGEMDMPIYVTPGYIRRRAPDSKIERQCFMFDKNKISSAEHLSYLWLVLTKNEREGLQKPDSSAIFGQTLAFNAHLTQWRPPASALTRARFYILNYLRSGGSIKWAPPLDYSNADSFAHLFSAIPAQRLTDILLTSELVSGVPKLDDFGIYKTPLSAGEELKFAHHRNDYESGLIKLTDSFVEGRFVPSGSEFFIDITGSSQVKALFDAGNLELEFNVPLASASVSVRSIHSEPPFSRKSGCKVEVTSERLKIQPELDIVDSLQSSGPLQIALCVAVWCKSDEQIIRCKIKPR